MCIDWQVIKIIQCIQTTPTYLDWILVSNKNINHVYNINNTIIDVDKIIPNYQWNVSIYAFKNTTISWDMWALKLVVNNKESYLFI